MGRKSLRKRAVAWEGEGKASGLFDFWDYGARRDQHTCSDGFVFEDKENCLAIYSDKHDPTQARTANEIARFSEKDADTSRRVWALAQSDELMRVTTNTLFRPLEEQRELSMESSG